MKEIFKFDKVNGILNGYVDEIKNGLKINDKKFNKYKDLVIPTEIDGVKVISIGNYAFASNQLTSMNIFDGVKYIGYGAFENNQLTFLTIPDSVFEIATGAFQFNQLIEVNIPENVKYIGFRCFWKNQLTFVNIPIDVKILGSAFDDDVEVITNEDSSSMKM